MAEDIQQSLDLSLVLACYNEEPIIEDSIREILQVLDHIRLSYEIILVDDCSQDRTRELIDKIIAQNPSREMRKLFHEKNIGRGGAVTDGIRLACGDVVGFIDIDLEVPAHYILPCVVAIRNGADVATAWRKYEQLSWRTLHRWFVSQGYIFLVKRMLATNLKDTETGYKFFNRKSVLPILDHVEDGRWFWDTEIMARSYFAGLNIIEIPAIFIKRPEKKSTVNIVADSVDYVVKLLRFQRSVRNLDKRKLAGKTTVFDSRDQDVTPEIFLSEGPQK